MTRKNKKHTDPQEYAKNNGYTYIGTKTIEVEYPLTEKEKIDLGKDQSEHIIAQEKLENEFAKVRKEYKTKIEFHDQIIKESSIIIDRGSRLVDEDLPCFFDPDKEEKHYINLETGEIIESRVATDADRQGVLI